MYSETSALNFIRIHSDLAFLSHIVYGVMFTRTQCRVGLCHRIDFVGGHDTIEPFVMKMPLNTNQLTNLMASLDDDYSKRANSTRDV